MRNLFDPAALGWPQLRHALHVYVLPTPEFSAALSPARELVAGFPGCAAVEPAWLHATVTRIPWFGDKVGPDLIEAYSVALSAMAAGTAPFTISMSGPAVDDYSVGVRGLITPQWQSLVYATRAAAVTMFGPEPALPQQISAPHVSLGYGIDDCDATALIRATERNPLHPIDFPVDAVHFLAVHQDPIHGTFTWDLLSTHPLG